MQQNKLESLIESLLNQFTGIFTAYITWVYLVVPLYDLPYKGFIANLSITLIFTCISIIRSYVWRRFFNKGLHKKVHELMIKLYNGVKK